MARITASDLAAHIAGTLDGDWDDGLEVHVSARASENTMHMEFSDDGNQFIGAFRVTVEKVD